MSTRWALFILCVLQTTSFGLIMQHWGFGRIDEIRNPDQVRSHISQISEVQRHVHALTTATRDVAYPLTYGSPFAGITISRFRLFFPLTAFAVIPIDLAKGYVQMASVSANSDILAWKTAPMPTELGLFLLPGLIALLALARIFTIALKRILIPVAVHHTAR